MGLKNPESRPTAETSLAVITGTTRDVGEFTAYGFAQIGWNVIGVYRNPKHQIDQETIVDRVQRYKVGGKIDVRMETIQADVVHPATPGLIVACIDKVYKGGVNALILNAAGGYRKPIEEARAINVQAQTRLVDGLLDRLAPGSVIVYLNSEAGHRFHTFNSQVLSLLGDYTSVAQSKNEAEQALRERIEEFSKRGIRLAIVAGNALEGTFVAGALKRQNPDLVDKWQSMSEEGYFPTAMDMATAVVRCVRDNNLPSGHTEYVGIGPEFQIYPRRPLRESLLV